MLYIYRLVACGLVVYFLLLTSLFTVVWIPNGPSYFLGSVQATHVTLTLLLTFAPPSYPSKCSLFSAEHFEG